MAKNFEKEIIGCVKKNVISEGGPDRISTCPEVLLKSASFGKAPKEKEFVNAATSAEFFYQALYRHYWKGRGKGADIIRGDYYGSIAILYAAKLKDKVVLDTFCSAIQEATKDKDNDYKAAGRLAKIYGASAFIGAYLAGLSGGVLEDFRQVGEKTGLKLLSALSAKEWRKALDGVGISSKFLANLQENEKSALIKNKTAT